MASAMKALGTTKSEHDINLLMQQHIAEHDKCEARWSNELYQLQESQRNEYRDWVATVYNEMESYDKKDKSEKDEITLLSNSDMLSLLIGSTPYMLTPPKARYVTERCSLYLVLSHDMIT